MRVGHHRYADLIDALNEAGLPTTFIQTGGMNAALEVTLETKAVVRALRSTQEH